MPFFDKSTSPSRNNGTLTHNYDDNGGGGGGGTIMDERSSDIMLQPMVDQQQQHHTGPLPVIVSYGPGNRTNTSVPQIVNYSHISNLVSGGRCYCKTRRIRSKLIVLAVAVLVMGTAIGALIMYFSGSFQCFTKNGKKLYYFGANKF